MKFTKNVLMAGALCLVGVVLFVYLSQECFENPPMENIVNAHKYLPTVNPAQIASVKDGIINVINNRPDLVSAFQQVLADPAINPTVQKVLNTSGNTSGPVSGSVPTAPTVPTVPTTSYMAYPIQPSYTVHPPSQPQPVVPSMYPTSHIYLQEQDDCGYSDY